MKDFDQSFFIVTETALQVVHLADSCNSIE